VKIQIDVDCFVDLFAVAAPRLDYWWQEKKEDGDMGQRPGLGALRGRGKRQMLVDG